VLFDIFRRVGISVNKEAPVNFLIDPQKGRSTLRPANIVVYGWVGGKHACVNLTGVSPLVGLGVGTLLSDEQPSKLLQAKWPNMRERALTINMFSYHLHSTFLVF
jgi:hypothetical protein